MRWRLTKRIKDFIFCNFPSLIDFNAFVHNSQLSGNTPPPPPQQTTRNNSEQQLYKRMEEETRSSALVGFIWFDLTEGRVPAISYTLIEKERETPSRRNARTCIR